MFVWTCVDGTPALWVVSSAAALDPISFQFLEFAPGGYGAVGGTHKCQQAQSFLSAAPVSFLRAASPLFRFHFPQGDQFTANLNSIPRSPPSDLFSRERQGPNQHLEQIL